MPRIFVGNISNGIRDVDLVSAFAQYGRVEAAHVPLEWPTQRPRGYAFVDMEDPLEAREAVESLDGRELNGLSIRVEIVAR